MKRLLLVGFLAGCTTVGPDYERPPVALPKEYIPEEKQVAVPQVPFDWWTLYNDATLSELVQAARQGNVELRIAAARVREAEALAREAGAAIYPDITGGFGASRNRVSQRTEPPPAANAPLERSLHSLTASTSFDRLDFASSMFTVPIRISLAKSS